MRRWLGIATLGLTLVAMPAWAQRHGGGGGHAATGFSSHSSGSIHASGIRASSIASAHASVRGVNPARGSKIDLRIGDPFRHHRGVYGRRSYYPYAAYYPYGYYDWYADSLYDNDDQDVYAEEYRPAPYREDSGVQRDLDQLNGKVDRLQADVEARNHPKADAEPATALVFRDQHVEEVHNYAIAGDTLWVLNDQAKKIPLAQLDVPATIKMNDERGVDFQVPGPSLSLQIVR
ncbi:MAG: hypothetical protein WCF68_10020 [Terriglobales bacterium]